LKSYKNIHIVAQAKEASAIKGLTNPKKGHVFTIRAPIFKGKIQYPSTHTL
jgi:hypothetical protein